MGESWGSMVLRMVVDYGLFAVEKSRRSLIMGSRDLHMEYRLL